MSEENTTFEAESKEKTISSTLSIVALVICLLVPARLFLSIFAILALYFSIKTKNLLKEGEASLEKARKNSKRALVLALTSLVLFIAATIGFIALGAAEPIKYELGKLSRRQMLTNLYARLDAYQSKFGYYPNEGEGVQALYPLYKEGFISRRELEGIFQPPSGEFRKFSEYPKQDEFDAYHIGWSYNAKARPKSEDPLISYQGVNDGTLHFLSNNPSVMPLARKDVIVVFANGKIEYVGVIQRTGQLLSDFNIDWSLLKD